MRFGEGQLGQNTFYFRIREQIQFDGIFQIQQGIANIVGSLHQIRQRMARPAVYSRGNQPQFVGNLTDKRQLGLINIEFLSAVWMLRCPRILQQCADGCRSQAHSACLRIHFKAGDDTQAMRIAFIGLNIVAFRFV